MATYTILPGVADKATEARKQGFDPGLPREAETYWDSNHSVQKFERGTFMVTKYPDPTTNEDRWDVDYLPDTNDLIAFLTANFTAA